jgi:ATP-binding cassette, subfamily B, bacterial
MVYNVLIPFAVALGLQAIITKDFDGVGKYVLYVLLLAALYCVLWAVGGVAICKNGYYAAMHIQKAVFSNYLQKDYEFYSDSFVGALGAQATRLRDAFNEYNQLALIAIPKQAIIVVTSIVIIAYSSLLLAGITLLLMVAVLSFTVFTSRWRLRYRRKMSEASSSLAGIIGDALSHGDTVKSYANEKFEERRLDTGLRVYGKAQYISWMASIPADVGRMILAGIATAGTLWLTASLYQQGAISIAVVVLVQLFVIRLVTSTLEIAEIIKSYEVTMGSAHQAVSTMLVEQEVNDPVSPARLPKNKRMDVAFSGVTYAYKGTVDGHSAVEKFDLTISQGEKIGLVGYSGSGKTTLTKLLLRFMDVADGSIKLGGIDLRDIKQEELRRYISYVPQEPLLFHRSIQDNIRYGRPGASKQDIARAARAAYVEEFVSGLPMRYDTLVGERGVKLSGGQRQRVAIARALLKDAPILVLDEATSALDSRSEQLIQKALWKLMEGRTALVIAHRLSTIQRMDRIAVMDKGKIVQLGTHRELLRDKKGIYAQLWAHQSGGYVGAPAQDSGGNDAQS